LADRQADEKAAYAGCHINDIFAEETITGTAGMPAMITENVWQRMAHQHKPEKQLLE